ncbi:MAG: U-box domain-containing protein [Gammaproteobacteria bacterium]
MKDMMKGLEACGIKLPAGRSMPNTIQTVEELQAYLNEYMQAISATLLDIQNNRTALDEAIQREAKNLLHQLSHILTCPIKHMQLEQASSRVSPETVFVDPVTTPDGFTYERSLLLGYLNTHQNKTPTGEVINAPNTQLIPNHKIKFIADEYRSTQTINSTDLEDVITCDRFQTPIILASDGHSYDDGSLAQIQVSAFDRSQLDHQKNRENKLLETVVRFYNDNELFLKLKMATYNISIFYNKIPENSMGNLKNIRDGLGDILKALQDPKKLESSLIQ